MALRIAVVSTAKNTNKIVEHLKTEFPSEIEIVLHFGDKSADIKASSLARMNARKGRYGHIFENQRWSGAAQTLIESTDFTEKTEEFIDQLHRISDTVAVKSHPLRTMADYSDYYHILADVLAQKLLDTHVETVLFFNVPHLTYDLVLYQTAQALGIRTLIVTQSLFPNTYWSLNHVGDLGHFDLTHEAPAYPIEKSKPLDLFYMNGIKQEAEKGGPVSAQAWVQLLVFLAIKRPWKAFNLVYVWRLVQGMRRVYGRLPKWRDPFAKFFHENSLAYFDHLATFERQELDLSGNFVYFPLQLQPEMTTSALGGRFRDQAYAIERLAAILPDGVRILVKENPKQGAYMRGPLFFHRLKRIPNVTFLPSWANTHELTAKCRFVASITGTVGWEAVRQGKPALVFGKAWYKKFQGVHEWHDEISYDDIINEPIDHATLEQNVGSLLAQAHQGVIDRHYTKIVPDFDEIQNIRIVAATLVELLRRQRRPTFGSTVNL